MRRALPRPSPGFEDSSDKLLTYAVSATSALVPAFSKCESRILLYWEPQQRSYPLVFLSSNWVPDGLILDWDMSLQLVTTYLDPPCELLRSAGFFSFFLQYFRESVEIPVSAATVLRFCIKTEIAAALILLYVNSLGASFMIWTCEFNREVELPPIHMTLSLSTSQFNSQQTVQDAKVEKRTN